MHANVLVIGAGVAGSSITPAPATVLSRWTR